MFRFRRNKSELIVLTGAIYAFVAYLTAFTLEVLFIIDLTRRSNEILSAATTTTNAHTSTSSPSSPSPSTSSGLDFSSDSSLSTNNEASSHPSSIDDDLFLRTTGLDRFRFESIQAHITISCLAISILYFVIFITSLILIVALILRSTFMLLIWMCAMITMYLPEFCLVAYVSVYCWGPDTRNGQTEIVFYLFRAVLNGIFIFRAHKLFKQLNYEKNFFRLKSGGRTSVSSQFAGYDSPYFIGDSLNTTINPVFNSSTLNLNRYDYIRDHHFQLYGNGGGGSSGGQSPATNNSMFDSELTNDRSQASSSTPNNHEPGPPSTMFNHSTTTGAATRARLAAAFHLPGDLTRGTSPKDRQAARKSRQTNHQSPQPPNNRPENYSKNLGQPLASKQLGKFYLGDVAHNRTSRHKEPGTTTAHHQQHYQSSLSSINDELAECELDLDYRTLGRTSRQAARESMDHHRHPLYSRGQQLEDREAYNNNRPRLHSSISRSQDNLPAYSTQSLDRRNLRDFGLTDQVILRPLGHQPFEYLYRPGSTSNLDHVATDPNMDEFRHHRRDHYSRH